MSLKRLYEAKDINWILIPDLLEKVASEITNNYNVEIQNKLVTNKNFSIDTISQHVDVDNSEEFLSFLKKHPSRF